MKVDEVKTELSKSIDSILVEDLVSSFIELKRDVQTNTLHRTSIGKFVETIVQVLEYLENGSYSSHPNVDSFLKNLESRNSTLNDDLRICLSRVARAAYTLRNKRNIAHKGMVEANLFDLRFTFSIAQWILTELVRQYVVNDNVKSSRIVEFIQAPVNQLVEEISGRKIIFGDLSVPEEILTLLYSEYPNHLTQKEIGVSLDRRAPSSISNSLKKLWADKKVHKDEFGYKLTQIGFKEAESIRLKILS
jgi:hypothetical protein